jgi:glycosyltransferase involved in cell wall biosynthesis
MVPRLEVQRLMLRSRALVSPSVTYEVSPISVVEAFAAGVPAIVPRGGAQASIVDHRRTGLHFSGDASSLRDAMCRLLDDETCRQMGARARTTYEVRHSNATVLQVLEEAYERARRRDGRRP